MSDRDDDDAKMIMALEAEIESLQARIAELEDRLKTTKKNLENWRDGGTGTWHAIFIAEIESIRAVLTPEE